MQEVEGTQVEDLCERIGTAIANFSLHVRRDKRARVGISLGTATFGVDGETLDQLVIVADQAMYRIKSDHKLRRTTRELQTVVQATGTESDELASTSVN